MMQNVAIAITMNGLRLDLISRAPFLILAAEVKSPDEKTHTRFRDFSSHMTATCFSFPTLGPRQVPCHGNRASRYWRDKLVKMGCYVAKESDFGPTTHRYYSDKWARLT